MKEQPIQVTVVFSESFATPDAIATIVAAEGCWFETFSWNNVYYIQMRKNSSTAHIMYDMLEDKRKYVDT